MRDQAALEQDLTAGTLKALVVLGSDPLSDAATAKAAALPALVVIAAHESGLAAAAAVTLGCGDWAEVSGTITNRQGKVQRLRPAFPPPGQTLPAGEVLVRLARKLGATFESASAKAVFNEMKQAVPAMVGAEFGGEQPTVQLRFATSRG